MEDQATVSGRAARIGIVCAALAYPALALQAALVASRPEVAALTRTLGWPLIFFLLLAAILYAREAARFQGAARGIRSHVVATTLAGLCLPLYWVILLVGET